MALASHMSRLGKAYVSTVITFGLIIVGVCVYQLFREPVPFQWFLLAALTLLTGSATVQLPSSHASISISEVFVFIAILLYGPAAGTVVVALDGLVISFWLAKRHRELYRALFNMSAPAVAAWCSAKLFFLTSGIEPLSKQPSTLNHILPFLAISAAAYFCLNTWLITFAISLERRINAFKLWLSSFAWLWLTYVCGASIAALVTAYSQHLDFAFFGVIVPLLLVLYFTFRTTMGRLEDAHSHVGQLNTLYLSTIETLAMAIDAKDQVTHGHIRRVQSRAVTLARRVGVTDEQQIRAIEAAALLHDTGKLAVPEHILNKPGRLTFAEFEKMKLHASIGADILSAIAFPYPVVPIVRHHHENWDGSGYPSGLSGTEIPIGARILAVVDCFDALTSDRPYRPRLSDNASLSILMERRGSMYDPLMVDAFIRLHSEEISELVNSDLRNVASNTRALQVSNSPEPNAVAHTDAQVTSHDQAAPRDWRLKAIEMGDAIATYLRRLVPSSICVVFVYDSVSDELEAVHAFGEYSAEVKGLRIPSGRKTSNRNVTSWPSIIDSDSSFELSSLAQVMAPTMRSCLATPFFIGGRLAGMLALYSTSLDAFNEDHRGILEAVTRETDTKAQRAPGYRTVAHDGARVQPVEQRRAK